jgi:simple sugar transport system substrate-binding protein
MQRRTALKLAASGVASTFAPGLLGRASAAEPLKAAWVYVAPVGDVGWSYSHDLGRKAVAKAFGSKLQTSFVESVPEGPQSEHVFRDLAMAGNKVIFATSFGYMDSVIKVARQFPDVEFQQATGYKTAPNVGEYDVRTYEGAYLAGIVAGSMTKTNKIGFVATFPIPEVVRNINAFNHGARSVNPKVTTNVVWISTWYDPGKERQAALTLISQGADALLQNSDSPAVVQAAEEKKVWAFGWDSDMHTFAPTQQLGAVALNWTPRYTEVIQGVLDGTLKRDASVWYGLKQKSIALTRLNPAVPAAVHTVLEQRVAGIISGEHPVFEGPIKDQSGKIVVPAGTSLEDAQLHQLHYYMEGVQGTLPGGR